MGATGLPQPSQIGIPIRGKLTLGSQRLVKSKPGTFKGGVPEGSTMYTREGLQAGAGVKLPNHCNGLYN